MTVSAKTMQDLMTFLDSSPTSWHAVNQVRLRLEAAGFQELKEEDTWQIAFGGKYFVIRNGSIIAFQAPLHNPLSAHIAASHTDSPTFKLKSCPEFVKDNMVMLGVEVYGSPIISSWLNRDLKIAGRVFYLDKNNKRQEALVSLDECPVMIPQLAIHLDRKVSENQANETGATFNKQDHLAALAALDVKQPYLETALKKKCDAKSILSFDLFLCPTEKAALIGAESQMIASYRIDSLLSVHAALTALLNNKKADESTLKAVTFFDHEEVGSDSAEGAGSPFLSHVLERILLSLHLDREHYFRMLAKSLLLSVDLAHAVHPNYKEKHEPQHQPLLNHGIVIKQNAKLSYASNGSSISKIVELCQKNRISFQHFVARNDMPCGSTIGRILAAKIGIETVDIGTAQLSMHSCRELASVNDQLEMIKLLTAFFKTSLED